MKELEAIIAAYRKVNFTERKAALATVVRVKGSSYRSPGAHMLILDDGQWMGSISGGCLEGDALRKARRVMEEGISLKVIYDTREEANQSLGIGLGCNGVIEVLFEPLSPASSQIDLFEKIQAANILVVVATQFSPDERGGRRAVIDYNGTVMTSDFSGSELQAIQVHANKTFEAGRSAAITLENEVEIFLELIRPNIELMIFGGGYDARPLCMQAKALGWKVAVTDECVAHLAPLFFPQADHLSLCNREVIDQQFNITPSTACVLMSHNYAYDKSVLRKLLSTFTPYIGILGPRKRFDRMVTELAEEHIHLTDADRHRIHSPIGLDIGAETSDEIALSILAEIQAKFADRSGGFLKYRSGPIHQRHGKTEEVFKEVFLPTADFYLSSSGK